MSLLPTRSNRSGLAGRPVQRMARFALPDRRVRPVTSWPVRWRACGPTLSVQPDIGVQAAETCQPTTIRGEEAGTEATFREGTRHSLAVHPDGVDGIWGRP